MADKRYVVKIMHIHTFRTKVLDEIYAESKLQANELVNNLYAPEWRIVSVKEVVDEQ